MKEIEVQTEDKNKNIVYSSVIKVDEDSDRIKVVLTVGTDNPKYAFTKEQVGKVHESFSDAIEKGAKVITVPWFVKVNTIKI